MKKVLALLLVLIATLMFTACNKDNPRSLLIGSWNVTATITLKERGVATDRRGNISFGKGGKGNIFINGNPNKAFDFTYSYHKKDNTIAYELKGKPYVWEVDVLTDETFRFHSNHDATEYLIDVLSSDRVEITFKGEKIE